MKLWKPLCLALALTACGAPQSDQSVSEAPPPSESAEMPDAAPDRGGVGFEDAVQLEAVTDFLYPSQDFMPEDGAMPVGVVLLSPDMDFKNAALCDAYVKDLRTYEEASEASPDADFLITYWPLKAEPESFSSCDALRANYDYERAADLKARYGLAEATGPVFLAVDSSGDAVFLDLSDATAEATREAVTRWLALALESSEDEPSDDTDEAASGGDSPAELADGPAARFSLAGFSRKIRDRLLSPGGEDAIETQIGGRTLFALSDPGTGYRIGSTIRF